jgi:hypothetical protein
VAYRPDEQAGLRVTRHHSGAVLTAGKHGARESRRSPPLAFFSPWHFTQVPARTGRTFVSKKLSEAAFGKPARAAAVFARKTVVSARVRVIRAMHVPPHPPGSGSVVQ